MKVPAGSAWKSDRPRALASAWASVMPSAWNGISVALPSAPTARKVWGSRTRVSTSLGRRKMFSRGLDTIVVIGTVAVCAPRDSRTKVSDTGERTPPAEASTSRSRSPLAESGMRAPAAASPVTVTVCEIGRVTETSTWGWMALPASSASMSACTSWGRRPATGMRPA
ncbi:hypothetical protein OCOJLMKI_5148 [Methylobacterium iners]|uniref:Uncharacterized protein n=1 Tax=Methylobacterium iners TaxID=418707 RepID=A0ABQ4S5Y3_9HYPH|nr:hypothetical protein OCOJLMKI_5148 [Methylobacterium iners]